MLLHPWLGEVQVILQQPGEISFNLVELGIARVQFVVRRYDPPTPPPTDTLGALLTKADALIDNATLTIEQVLAPVALPLALFGSVGSFLSQARGIWDSYLGTGDTGDIAACAQPSLNALAAGVEAPASNVDTTFADSVAALLFATALAIAVAAQAPTPPAIGSASGVTLSTDPVVDPTQAVTVMLAVAAAIAAVSQTPAASVTGSALAPLAIATGAAILAQAVSVGVSLPFVSQQDAITWRGTLDAALAQLAVQVVAIGVQQPIAANAVFQGISDMRAALAADINALIGRLPAVITITTNKTMSAWLIALHLSGDTPSAMVATLQDVVARNGVVNPGVVPAGTLEVLQS